MQEIKCPNCGEVFQVDESSYDSIVKQVRDKEFSKEIEEREKHYAKEKAAAIRLAQAETTEQLNKELSRKDAEIIALQAKLKSEEDNKKTASRKKYGEISYRRCRRSPFACFVFGFSFPRKSGDRKNRVGLHFAARRKA